MSKSATKLIFAGLDKAGKTTIYKATMEEMSAQEVQNLAPTKGIERHTTDYLDKDFSVWDLGGQASYRESYLSKPEIFNQTKAMIFVVDIQDIDRIEQSYQYFVDILQILKNVDPAPKLYVLFHKYDPEIAGKLKSHFYRAARLFRKADQITPNKFKFYLTSIFSNSIDLAVKRILFENFDDFEEPTDMLTTTPKTKVKEDTPPPSVGSIHDQGGKTEEKIPESPSVSTPAPGIPSVPKSGSASKPSTPTPEPKTSTPAPEPKPSVSAPEPKISRSAPEPQMSRSAPEPTPTAPEPETESTKVELETEPESVEIKQEEEKPPVTEEQEVKSATPTNLFDLSEELVTKLTDIVERRMTESVEIVALSILSSEGKQVLAVGKSSDDYEKLETLKDVVSALNPKQFYKELSDIEYRGLGHFSLQDFDIYFARASDDYAIAIIATDVSTLMLQNAQRIVNSIRQGMGMMDGEDAPDEPGTKPKIKKKKDLVQDLRSRLKGLSGLNDLE